MNTKPEKPAPYYFRPTSGNKTRSHSPLLLFRYSTVGINTAIPIFLGLTTGLFLDNLFRVRPFFTLVFLFFGVIGSFYNIFRIIKENGGKHPSY